ncbi:MAG TPA: glutamate--tRNA ligase [Anaerolineae bacterium]|nr:glutamate--tRNA ligase [Anaerolineae bacterium]
MTDKPVRVRFAPSPTGYFHIGGARTALYNWLFARHHGGTFILRIEDTDRTRYQEEAEEDILTSLSWLGLNWDEGPGVGGDYGPYYQSERLELYQDYAEDLLEDGYAYKCFCTTERLSKLRKAQRAAGATHVGYDRHCRDLTPAEVAEREDKGLSSVIRLKVPLEGQTTFRDVLRGTTTVENALIEDIVLIKSDGFPTYHMANVVDDHSMQISHIMRGDEWLSSCPIHIILYDAFSWDPPVYVHLPLILDPGGHGKMSKRKTVGPGGQEYLVLVRDFRAAGYVPDALINFIARVGWSYDDRSELFTRRELIEKFSFDGLNASPARFDYDKLDWMAGVYMREADVDELADRLLPFYHEVGLDADLETVRQIVPLLQPRIKKLSDALPLSSFFFKDEITIDPGLLIGKKMDAASSLSALQRARDLLAQLDPFTPEALEQPFRDLADELGIRAGPLFGILRAAVTGQQVSPPLFESMSILGRERTLGQLDKGIDLLRTSVEAEAQ